MDSSFSFPDDDYALTILTQAAIRDTPRDPFPSGRSPTSKPPTRMQITYALDDNLDVTDINDINGHGNTQRASPAVSASRTPELLSDYNLSARNMETLAFNSTSAGGRMQSSYMNAGFQGIGNQISQNYANSLGILSAKAYDGERETSRDREESAYRLRHREPAMPFGITSGPKINLDLESRTESEELDSGARRRKKPRIEPQSDGDDEEAKKKARGRPRVEAKDETAADRRRTQIRMAQRAYRHRKETTISSLEKQVQGLKGTNEEMSNIFISLYDFAVGKGLLDREPEFGRQLQSTTERFLALAKLSEDHDEVHDHDVDKIEDPGEVPRKTKGRRASPKKTQEATPPISEPSNPWGGYTLSKEDSPIEEIDMGYRTDQQYRQIITKPTEDNASFPFEFMNLQQYRVAVPDMEDFSQTFFQSQPSLPTTHAYHEFSFARRIHRASLERAARLIKVDPQNERFKQVFGFCMLYESIEAIEARIMRLLAASTKETLQEWRAPFVHVGGAGTYYPLHDSDINGEMIPKFRTGYSMGPFDSNVSHAQQILDEDMKCNLPGFEGEFFDANDVEGYLRGRGLDILPAADFATGELDLLALTEMPSPKSHRSDTVSSILSPQTPHSPVGSLILDSAEFAKNDGNPTISKLLLNEPCYNGFDADNNPFIDPHFNIMDTSNLGGARNPNIVISSTRYGQKSTVTINVKTLLNELISRAVCLGRATGFRPADVNAAIIAAVSDGF